MANALKRIQIIEIIQIIQIIKIIEISKQASSCAKSPNMVLFSDYCMSRLRKLTIRTIAVCSDRSDLGLAPEDAGGSPHAAAVTIHSDCLETTVVAATLNSKREDRRN